MESRRRVTLYDQMSAVDSSRNSLAGLILDAAAMANHKSAAASSRRQLSSSRTLLDIIREDDPNKKGRRSWKVFRDKLRLKRAGSAWFPAIHIPVSDISIPNRNSTNARLNSNSDTPATSTQPQTSRSDSLRRDGAITTFRDCFDYSSDDDDVSDPAREGTRRLSSVISEERALSAREAEAAAAAAAAEEEEEPVRMSLMDLLEETDRQMGFEGSGYRMGDDEGCENEKEKKEEEEEEEVGEEYKGGISIEENCCVCMVRRKGAAFIPCGHTFCRHCSRELWVSRGHCPLCNNLILEILDLF